MAIKTFNVGDKNQDPFQQLLFSKIVPNTKKLGLLDANDGWLRKRFDTLGVTQFEDWADTGEEYSGDGRRDGGPPRGCGRGTGLGLIDPIRGNHDEPHPDTSTGGRGVGLAASGGAPGPTTGVWDRWRMQPSADRPSDGVRWWQTRSGSIGVLWSWRSWCWACSRHSSPHG